MMVSDDDGYKDWLIPLFLVFTLYLIASLVSEPGLDWHVRGAYVPVDGGYTLDWGETRPTDPLASNPDDAEVVATTGFSPAFYSLLSVAGIFVAYLVARAAELSRPTLVILLLNPALIFSYGKGYDEFFILAMLGLAWLLWSQNRRPESGRGARIIVILTASASASTIPLMKFLLTIPQWLLCLTIIWVFGLAVEFAKDEWFSPRRTMVGGFLFGVIVLLLLGVVGYGSFSVITTDTARSLQAWPVAVFGVLCVYGMVGMVLWPFARETWGKMGDIQDREIGELALLIGTLSGVIVTYVASLWVFESVLWNSPWPWHMWTLGNNGRYITIVAIPAFLLVKKVNGEIDWSQRKALVGIAMIVPLSLAAGLHGQTYWTDEAGAFLSEEMDEDGEFLFIHDATLGMHYLYTFHTYIDEAHERNITGQWRAPESGWQDELLDGHVLDERGDLSSVGWVVFSPETGWERISPHDWEEVESGEADFLNGGGEWSVWRKKGGDSAT